MWNELFTKCNLYVIMTERLCKITLQIFTFPWMTRCYKNKLKGHCKRTWDCKINKERERISLEFLLSTLIFKETSNSLIRTFLTPTFNLVRTVWCTVGKCPWFEIPEYWSLNRRVEQLKQFHLITANPQHAELCWLWISTY